MAIVMMCEPTAPGAVLDEYWTKEAGREIWRCTTHEGRVLELREWNMRDDSDFYAVVWNDEKNEPERVDYASTRGWTYPNGAAVDATPEVVEKYKAYLKARDEAARALAWAREAKTPKAGRRAKTARNVRGKNAIEAGVAGTIFWVGKDFYGKGMRVGFEADDGRKVFLAGNALEVEVNNE